MAKRPSRSRSQADDSAAGAVPEPALRRTSRTRPAAAGKPTSGSNVDADNEISAADTGPSEEEIRLRAYHRYLERGGGHGMDFDDWLEAERELRVGKRKSGV